MIKGYIGTYGSGKTLQMVRDAQWFFNKGYRVISNFPLWGYKKKGLFKKPEVVQAEYLYSEDVLTFLQEYTPGDRNTLLLVDEASNIFDSYKFKQIPTELFAILKQQRKIKLDLFYTSQRHTDIATRVRDNSEAIYICEKWFKNTFFTLFSAMAVKPFYFNDNAKSTDLKRYTIKRRINFAFTLKNFYKFYSTDFVVTSKLSFSKFASFLGDPENMKPSDIQQLASQHLDISPPI